MIDLLSDSSFDGNGFPVGLLWRLTVSSRPVIEQMIFEQPAVEPDLAVDDEMRQKVQHVADIVIAYFQPLCNFFDSHYSILTGSMALSRNSFQCLIYRTMTAIGNRHVELDEFVA